MMINKNEKILICKEGVFGGANLLLDRLYNWLKQNDYTVECCIVSKNEFPKSLEFKLTILPSYKIDDIYILKKKGYKIERILLWIMGMGCFQDGYYNPFNVSGIKGFITKFLKKEADKALTVITDSNSICFTDVVGRYNTYKEEKYALEDFEDYNLIPIGVKVKEFKENSKGDKILHACWVGRISYDFKFVPLIETVKKLDKYARLRNIDVDFTIVGNGDALNDLKSELSNVNINLKYIDSLSYDDLDSFFNKQDLAFVMGTSALDSARNSCPTIIITPIRYNLDEKNVYYRWIFESKGYSLGEYPGLDDITRQRKENLDKIMEEYFNSPNKGYECYEYAKRFDEDVTFSKMASRELPVAIDKNMEKVIKRYFYLKKCLNFLVKIVDKFS